MLSRSSAVDHEAIFTVTEYINIHTSGRDHIILDNGATHHLFRDKSLLSNVRELKHPVEYQGLGGKIRVTEGGEYGSAGLVHYSAEAPANILSFSALRRTGIRMQYDYDADEWLIEGRRTARFKCSPDGLYVCSPNESINVTTVSENEIRYSKREVAAAKKALQLKEAAGFPSNLDLAWALSRGDIINTEVTARDVRRMQDIYGPHLGDLKGKTKKSKPSVTDIEAIEPFMRESQSLEEDIMFVEGIPFFISLSTPLDLIIATEIKSRTASALWSAQQRHLAIYKSEGFNVHKIFFDREGGISKIEVGLMEQGYRLQQMGAGAHVPRIEAKIRVMKERLRGVINTLPYQLPRPILPWAVYYIVVRINSMPVHTRVDPTPARQILLGRKADASKDFALSFGQYVQVHGEQKITNTMRSRTEGAIALKPDENATGSWSFWLLKTWTLAHRRSWTALPIPVEVIDYINNKVKEEEVMSTKDPIASVAANEQQLPGVPMQGRRRPEEHAEPQFQPISEMEVTSPEASHIEQQPEQTEEMENLDADDLEDNECEQLPIGVDSDVGSDSDQDNAEEPETINEPETAEHFGRTNSRYNLRDIKRKQYQFQLNQSRARSQYVFNMSVRDGIDRYGDKAKEAIRKELQQLMEKGVFQPVHLKELSIDERRGVIPSKMFLKDKYKADGTFDKIKARLVAGGHRQDRGNYTEDQISSPTVNLTHAFIVGTIAAEENRKVVTADIGTAYPNAWMKQRVLMRINKEVTELLVGIYPHLNTYLNNKGEISVVLVRALYGCIESGKLWNETLSAKLESLHFVKNKYDDCVFNRIDNGVQCTVVIYVDDLLMSCVDSETINTVLDELRKEFNTVTAHMGLVHSYLGMILDFSEPKALRVRMDGFVEDMLKRFEVTGRANTPASENLFKVEAFSPSLSKELAGKFHTIVATLLYLGKRVRPDILCATSFLTTRVQHPTEEDWDKCQRVLKYVNGTKSLGIRLKGTTTMQVKASIDASHGVHEDGRGHSGLHATLEIGPIAVKSTKQKGNTKSSMESEVVGVSDGISPSIGAANFIEEQGYDRQPVILYQDNQAAIKLMTKGKSTNDNTRHIRLRYFFVSDKIAKGEVELSFKPTESMIADILTKPLQGAKFLQMRDQLLGNI
jgi:hypothetical protein